MKHIAIYFAALTYIPGYRLLFRAALAELKTYLDGGHGQ